jgi:hypothetical protein
MAEPDALYVHERVSGFSSTYLLSLRYPVTFLYIGNVVMHTSHGEDRRDHGYGMLSKGLRFPRYVGWCYQAYQVCILKLHVLRGSLSIHRWIGNCASGGVE